MKQTTVGGSKRKMANALAIAVLVVIFLGYMFPFLMVVINSLKQKRDIIKVLVKKSVGNFLNQQQLPITDIFYAVPIAFLSDCAQG